MQSTIESEDNIEHTDHIETELACPEAGITVEDNTVPHAAQDRCKRNCAGCPLARSCQFAKK